MNKQNPTPQGQNHIWLLMVENMFPFRTARDTSEFPHALLVYDLITENFLNLEVYHQEPSGEKILAFLEETIQKKAQPSTIEGDPAPYPHLDLRVAEKELFNLLSKHLGTLGVQLSYTPDEPAAELFKESLPNQLFRSNLPGILTGEGVTEELAGAFFRAAARFYRAAPWAYLSLMEPLSIRVLPHPKRFVCLQGNTGVLPGLRVFDTWEGLENELLRGPSEMKEDSSPEGYHTCFFSGESLLPLADVLAAEEYGWELSGERGYPFPASLAEDTHLRPNRDQLLWYQAALLALAEFAPSLERDPEGEFLPTRSVLPVQTSTGEQEVEINYPCGELDLSSLPVSRYQDVKLDYQAFLHSKADEVQSDKVLPENETDPAQALIRQAWQEASRSSRIMLAHQALSLSPQCADAYIILAEDDAETLGKSLRYYRQAVRLTEPKLKGKGPLDLEEIEDRYPSEIRPYLDAKEGLAHILTGLLKKADAVRHYQDILELIPEDPLYVRGKLLSLLLDLERVQEADRLLDDYPNPYNPDWQYTRALRLYQMQGNSRRSRRALQRALESSPLVGDHLINPSYEEGDEGDGLIFGEMLKEAQSYRHNFRHLWQRTPGAIPWLEDQTRFYEED